MSSQKDLCNRLGNIECGFEIGIDLFLRKEFSQALRFFTDVKKRSKGIWCNLARIQIGICYIRLREYDKAIKEFMLLKRRKLSSDMQQTVDNFLKFCIRQSQYNKNKKRMVF